MAIKYIISDLLDYSKLICQDAGPGYAKTMGWPAISLNNLSQVQLTDIIVIDNRLGFKEFAIVQELILNNPNVIFILRIVDPYFHNIAEPYYQWLIKIALSKNVKILSPYQPTELTLFFEKTTEKKILHVPYVYEKQKELDLLNLDSRLNKIIISGAISDEIYPYRSSIWLKSRRSLSRIFYDVLKHPGYAELSEQSFSHSVIGESYIQHLAQYKFMLICGSRCKIEFLKFNECIYAGCLPIGNPPETYPEHLKKLFYKPSVKNLTINTARKIYGWSEISHRRQIAEFREFMHEYRSSELLNKSLLNQL